MHFAQPDQISLAHQRLAAGIDVHMDAQLLALADDRIQRLQAQVKPVAVFRSPASGAVHIAGGGGIHQDGPGHVAVFPGFYLVLDGAALQAGVEQKILKKRLAHARIQIIQPQDQLIPVVFLVDHLADRVPLGLIPADRGKAIHQGHKPGEVLFRISFDILQRLADGEILHGVFDGVHAATSFPCCC